MLRLPKFPLDNFRLFTVARWFGCVVESGRKFMVSGIEVCRGCEVIVIV